MMFTLHILLRLLPLLALCATTFAASAAEWRSKSIYQIVTDRFALPDGNSGPCDANMGRYCGGNWRGIINKLDYIQGMGFDAIWISPVSANIEGSFRWGEPYHGYWTTDPTKLNPKFGTPADLKDLSNALHSRGMFLMVDVAVNHAAAASSDTSNAALERAAGGKLLFKKSENYHPKCKMNYGPSETKQMLEQCWFQIGEEGSNDISLMDLKTESAGVADVLNEWVGGFTKEYGIDGLRLDASKHMDLAFQHDLCKAAGVFCAGEVVGEDVGYLSQWTGPDGLDSVLGFSMSYGLGRTLSGGTTKPMSYLKKMIDDTPKFADPTVIPNFLDNHDVARYFTSNPGAAKSSNAIVGNFLISGIPTVYYGLEHRMKGAADPVNRDALWNNGGYSTTGETYGLIKKLNGIRNGLARGTRFHTEIGKVIGYSDNDIAILRNNVLIALTKRGEGGSGTWQVKNTPYTANSQVVDLLTCKKVTIESDRSIKIPLSGGQPFVFSTLIRAQASGFCQ